MVVLYCLCGYRQSSACDNQPTLEQYSVAIVDNLLNKDWGTQKATSIKHVVSVFKNSGIRNALAANYSKLLSIIRYSWFNNVIPVACAARLCPVIASSSVYPKHEYKFFLFIIIVRWYTWLEIGIVPSDHCSSDHCWIVIAALAGFKPLFLQLILNIVMRYNSANIYVCYQLVYRK